MEIRKFGLGSPSNIDLPYEYAGTIPSKELKKRLANMGVITQEEGDAYYVGDQILFSIGQGLLSATPLQMAVAYAAIANSGRVYEPRVAASLLAPGTRDARPGFADLTTTEIVKNLVPVAPKRRIEMTEAVRVPIVKGMARAITGPGVTFDYYHRTTGENLFKTYNYQALPIAGKTGTAQGLNNLPWNDSSVFGAFSLDSNYPYTAFAYLEKSGYGSQAAAPIVKCIFTALNGGYKYDPLLPADPLDKASNIVAKPSSLRNPLCLVGGATETRE